MTNIDRHASHFARTACRSIVDMFGIPEPLCSDVIQTHSVQTDKKFIVSIYYTGTVYGEYLLAMDEQTAAQIIGIEEPITDENLDDVREQICDAMSETLNTIVGESITDLQATYAKLTITAPRLIFGQIRYPQFQTGKACLSTVAGEIECHFCLDLMRLDLATSYSEALDSLLDVNTKLKDANRHLAEQQAQLVHSAKMASVGVLASGVAHEINNPLFFVDANLTTLIDYIKVIDSAIALYDSLCESLGCKDGVCPQELNQLQSAYAEHDLAFVIEDTKELVHETREGVARIKRIVQGLKDFSQVDRAGFNLTSINQIAESTCDLIGPQLPAECVLTRNFADVPSIACNGGEIAQAIAGVLLNAGQSLGESGKITLETVATETSVLIVVEDNGCGIAREELEHVFEPFYTTKPIGEGIGLGLSIAYGIFEKHQGAISIESQVGQGTKVTMRLPFVNNAVNC
jgi:signal transduction histidine kinase